MKTTNQLIPDTIHSFLEYLLTNTTKLSIIFSTFLIFSTPILSQNRLDISKGVTDTKLPQNGDRTIEYVNDGVIVTYTFKDALSLRSEDAEGTFKWMIPGFYNNQEEGFPDVPSRTDVFTIPYGYDLDINIIDEEYVDYEVSIRPALPAVTDFQLNNNTSQTVKAVKMKRYDGFFPNKTVTQLKTEYYRGRPIFKVMVSPIQYNANESLTRFYTKIKYKVSYRHTTNKASQSIQLPSVKDNSILERIGIPVIKDEADVVSKTNKVLPIDPLPYSKPGEKLLIITNLELEPAASLFSEWKRCIGYNVDIEVSSEWTISEVKNVIKSRYKNSLDYVLILGDDKIVPAEEFYSDSGEVSETDTLWSPYYLSDHPYVCMDGEDDTFADIHIGRIPASNLEQANNAIFKIMRYEMNPPLSSDFYNNGVHVGQLQTSLSYNYNNIATELSRFIFTSENVRNYLLHNYPDMNIARVYASYSDVSHAQQFRYNLEWSYKWKGYPFSKDDVNILEMMPEELQNPSFWYAWNTGRGAFYRCFSIPYTAHQPNPSYILYSGHGNVNRWNCPYVEVERNFIGDGLLNMIRNPIMLITVCCQNGKFNYTNCLAKAWLDSQRGAVGVFAASHFTYLVANFPMVEVIMNCIWPKGFITPLYGDVQNNNYKYEDYDIELGTVVNGSYPKGMTMGEVLDECTNQLSNYTSIDDDWCNFHKRIMHYFGDPTMKWHITNPGLPPYLKTVNSGKVRISGLDKKNCIVTVFNYMNGSVVNHFESESVEMDEAQFNNSVVTIHGTGIRPVIMKGDNVVLDFLTDPKYIN